MDREEIEKRRAEMDRKRSEGDDPSIELARREMMTRQRLKEAEGGHDPRRARALREAQRGASEEGMLKSPPGTQARGVRASKAEVPPAQVHDRRSMMENLRRSEHEREVLEKRFDELPAIQHLRELWQERSLLPNDPVFLLVEVLGLYEERQKKTLKQLMRVLEASDRFTVDGLMEIEERIKSVEKMEKSSAKLLPVMLQSNEMNDKLIGTLESIAETFMSLRDTLFEVKELLDERGLTKVLAAVASPVAAAVAGFLLGKYF